uniref:ATP synthase F0 subunit 8 n=1 Tax=Allacta robusta TaxID=3037031 RepID=UPI0027A07004|nr:ATP synthase F0 subunit 8 [Allacta robusta]WGO57005.1 ATP synthase F0 subunit 8 [Allacta robusta]
MPQMMPLSWLNMFMFFITMYMLFNTMNYFTMNKMKFKFYKMNLTSKVTSWKW